MTATDELRRMLDERDEYYKTSGNKTWWGRPIDRQTGKPINVFHYQAQPMGEGRLFVELQLAIPEQAIAATLGRGTCKADKLCDGYLYYTSYWCRGCGERFAYRPIGSKDRGASPKFCPNCGAKFVDPTTNDVDAEVDDG